MHDLLDTRTRKWLYQAGVAVIGLLVVYGLVGESEAAEWTVLLAAVLGAGEAGLAAANTPTRDIGETGG